VWGGGLLASGRKFNTNIENEAVKRTSELATEENRPAVTHDPRDLNADSKPWIPLSSLGPATLEIGRRFVAQINATPTYIISVIFRISLLEVGMDGGCVNNGVCIIRAFQGICLTFVRNNSWTAGRAGQHVEMPTRFAIHKFLDRASLLGARTEHAMPTRTFPWDHPKLEIIRQ
jgi:hypothetical protein